MEEVHTIRHMVNGLGKSIREVSREMGVSRNTVRKYLKQSQPEYRCGKRPRPKSEAVSRRIEELLEEWKGRTAGKQRIAAGRVWRQLIEEGFEVSDRLVRQIMSERRRREREVFVPLLWQPGDAAQVDFFEAKVDIAGQRRSVWKFVMRLMYSGRDFVWLFERCDQVSFLEGHVRAFAYFGGVPRRVIYDNLTAAGGRAP